MILGLNIRMRSKRNFNNKIVIRQYNECVVLYGSGNVYGKLTLLDLGIEFRGSVFLEDINLKEWRGTLRILFEEKCNYIYISLFQIMQQQIYL